jgi:hypothetical protein
MLERSVWTMQAYCLAHVRPPFVAALSLVSPIAAIRHVRSTAYSSANHGRLSALAFACLCVECLRIIVFCRSLSIVDETEQISDVCVEPSRDGLICGRVQSLNGTYRLMVAQQELSEGLLVGAIAASCAAFVVLVLLIAVVGGVLSLRNDRRDAERQKQQLQESAQKMPAAAADIDGGDGGIDAYEARVNDAADAGDQSTPVTSTDTSTSVRSTTSRTRASPYASPPASLTSRGATSASAGNASTDASPSPSSSDADDESLDPRSASRRSSAKDGVTLLVLLAQKYCRPPPPIHTLSRRCSLQSLPTIQYTILRKHPPNHDIVKLKKYADANNSV